MDPLAKELAEMPPFIDGATLTEDEKQEAKDYVRRFQLAKVGRFYFPTPLPGRNDPCPCNSGKKFKKCHMLSPPEVPAKVERKPLSPAAAALIILANEHIKP
jgi:hypothetical protein